MTTKAIDSDSSTDDEEEMKINRNMICKISKTHIYSNYSNNEKYSVDGLNTFNNNNFKKWLNKLKIKNKPATISSDLSEGEAVNEYMNRCSNIPGFKFLKN